MVEAEAEAEAEEEDVDDDELKERRWPWCDSAFNKAGFKDTTGFDLYVVGTHVGRFFARDGFDNGRPCQFVGPFDHVVVHGCVGLGHRTVQESTLVPHFPTATATAVGDPLQNTAHRGQQDLCRVLFHVSRDIG
jgi:hypothetical protein